MGSVQSKNILECNQADSAGKLKPGLLSGCRQDNDPKHSTRHAQKWLGIKHLQLSSCPLNETVKKNRLRVILMYFPLNGCHRHRLLK